MLWSRRLALLLCLLAAADVHAMFNKRGREYRHQQQPRSRVLRSNLADLFLSSHVSATRTKELFEDADEAGAAHVADLGKPLRHIRRNARRFLSRRLMKGSQWPPTYVMNVTVWDKVQQREVQKPMPILLPHELVSVLAKHNDMDKLTDAAAMAEESLQHLTSMKTKYGLSTAVGCGIWIDGVPCNWDRTESLEIVSFSLPGCIAYVFHIVFL